MWTVLRGVLRNSKAEAYPLLGGALFNGKGKVLLTFSKFMGVCGSNKAEMLAISEALWL